MAENFCDHCESSPDGDECACGCDAYENWCGCEQCWLTHWPENRRRRQEQFDKA